MNTNNDVKRFKTRRYYSSDGIIVNYNVIVNGKSFCDQGIDSDIKRYEEIRKLTTEQDEDYATGYLLDYSYIKNHYRLIRLDLNRQQQLDADPKAIQQIVFGGKLKNVDDDCNAVNADGPQNIFVLTILEKIKETRLRISQGGVTVL